MPRESIRLTSFGLDRLDMIRIVAFHRYVHGAFNTTAIYHYRLIHQQKLQHFVTRINHSRSKLTIRKINLN